MAGTERRSDHDSQQQSPADDDSTVPDDGEDAENVDDMSTASASGDSLRIQRDDKKKKKKKKKRPHTKQAQQPEDMQERSTWSYDDAFSDSDMQLRKFEPRERSLKQLDSKQNKGSSPGEDGGSRALSVRLDLNLEIEIQLKASIHGDLTLELF